MLNDLRLEIRRKLLAWYRRHGRVLPWRGETDPYRILVSEVMLQQTQVDRVITFYERFLVRFPTVDALAAAPAADVIRLWGGLGYNRRALFLQKTAQAVVAQGGWPRTIETLTELPGVGPYTSRALAAFAFGARVSVLDVNVRRWMQRVVFGPEWKRGVKDDATLQATADALVPRASYDWNQAIMDFGATVCTARNPSCANCPLAGVCRARKYMTSRVGVENFQPLRARKPAIPFKQSQRYVGGMVLMLLRNRRSSLSAAALLATLQKRDADISELRAVKALAGLAADGLVRLERGRIALP